MGWSDVSIRERSRRIASNDEPCVAILPFRDLTGDPDRTFFVNGLVEELVNEVNRYENVIAVPCRQATGGAEGDIVKPRVGDRVDARFVLGGSVRRDAVELKIAAQLTDTATVRQVWGRSYRVPLEGVRAHRHPGRTGAGRHRGDRRGRYG